MNSQKFYFTYGTSRLFPFRGGWTEVTAKDREEAVALFRIVHPDATPGIVNCSFIYPENEFRKTGMYTSGNLGQHCVETISLTVQHVQ